MNELPMVCIVRVAKQGYAEMYDFIKISAMLGAIMVGCLAGVIGLVVYGFPFIETVVTPFLSPILSPPLHAAAGAIVSVIALMPPVAWGVIIIALIVTSPVLYALWKCLR